MVESLNISKTAGLRILKGDLGKRKLCACFVPRSFTPKRRENRVTSCQCIIALADADKKHFNKIMRKIRPDILPMTPKQSDRVLNDILSAEETEIS
jgi:hypothetical protein